jgi:hypothetical protein
MRKSWVFLYAFLALGVAAFGQDDLDLMNPGVLTVQAYVDGPSELHVTTEGVYWVNGKNGKPGRLDGKNYPTYVNGVTWMPVWHFRNQERGQDQSLVHIVHSASVDFDFKLISVGYTKDDPETVKRSPITAQKEATEYVVQIPDPEPGAMWYKFTLTPQKGGAK